MNKPMDFTGRGNCRFAVKRLIFLWCNEQTTPVNQHSCLKVGPRLLGLCAVFLLTPLFMCQGWWLRGITPYIAGAPRIFVN